MSNDRELLELAAKAAGLKISERHQAERDALIDPEFASLWLTTGHTAWNPLTNGIDALELAVKLGICIEPYPLYEPVKHSVVCKQRRRSDQLRNHNPTEVVEQYSDSDPQAATRRAIVRAAAEIQRARYV